MSGAVKCHFNILAHTWTWLLKYEIYWHPQKTRNFAEANNFLKPHLLILHSWMVWIYFWFEMQRNVQQKENWTKFADIQHKSVDGELTSMFFSILRYWDIERMIQYFTIIEMTSIQRSLSMVVDRQTTLTKKHGAQNNLRVWTHIFSTNIYVFISYAKTFNTKCLWSKNPRQVQTPQLWEQTKALVGRHPFQWKQNIKVN